VLSATLPFRSSRSISSKTENASPPANKCHLSKNSLINLQYWHTMGLQGNNMSSKASDCTGRKATGNILQNRTQCIARLLNKSKRLIWIQTTHSHYWNEPFICKTPNNATEFSEFLLFSEGFFLIVINNSNVTF
jgi:hypothetical protein